MYEVYYAGGWIYSRGHTFHSKYLKVDLQSYAICKDEIKNAYHRNLQNLACGFSLYGSYEQVVMSAIFYFAIFDIDRVCWNKTAILFQTDEGTGLFLNDKKLLGITVEIPNEERDYAIFALVYNDRQFILDFVKQKPKISE